MGFRWGNSGEAHGKSHGQRHGYWPFLGLGLGYSDVL